jgi:competence protein ComEA
VPFEPADASKVRWDRLRASVVDADSRAAAVGPRHALPVELTGTLRALLVVVALAIVLAALLFWRGWPRAIEADGGGIATAEAVGRSVDPSPPEVASPVAVGSPSDVEIVVHVVGRVMRPGVVRLSPGSRVADAVAAAGGLRPGTNPASVNLARPLSDGEQIVVAVPASASAPSVSSGGAGASRSSTDSTGGAAKLDLNAASADDLEALDGIGPVLASRIVAYRADNGRFVSVEDLRRVSGIGPKIFAAISDQVRV